MAAVKFILYLTGSSVKLQSHYSANVLILFISMIALEMANGMSFIPFSL